MTFSSRLFINEPIKQPPDQSGRPSAGRTPMLLSRKFLILSLLTVCAGCSSTTGGRVDERGYANAAKYQSLDAYQLCTEEHPGELEKCEALVKLMDDDKKRLDRVTASK
jgi:hypothetical protein